MRDPFIQFFAHDIALKMFVWARPVAYLKIMLSRHAGRRAEMPVFWREIERPDRVICKN